MTDQPTFLAGGGTMGALMRAHDWSNSSLGPPETWPQSLRAVAELLLNSKFPMFVAWGEELGFLYNDAYAEILGAKHPNALGARFQDIWAEIWADVSPLIDAAMAGEAVYREDLPLVMNRRGFDERTWFTFSYSPVRDEQGHVLGMFCAVAETTSKVLTQHRQAFRLAIEERLRDLVDPDEAIDAALAMLGDHIGANWVGYGQVQADDVTLRLSQIYQSGVEPVLGDFPLERFGPDSLLRQRRGETEVCADVQADSSQDPAVWTSIDTRAFVSVPLMRDGRFVASLYVSSHKPRRWMPEEVALIAEVAGRVWDAVYRGRTEAALRAAEERYLALFNGIEQGFCTIEVAFDENDVPVDYRFLEVSPSFERQTGIENGAGRWMREIAPDQDQFWFDVYGRVALTGEPARFESYSTPLNRWWDVYAFRISGPRRIAVLFRDISDQKRAEAAIRENEARLAFLDRLGTETAALADADAVLATTTRLLGEHLNLSVCAYADMDDDQDGFTIRGDWAAPGSNSIVGHYRLADFGRLAVTNLSAGLPLVVNDNRDVGSFSTQLLQDLGYQTTWAANAHEALQLLSDVDGFDVVFSDVVMPGMSGVELGQEIRRRYPDLPVVLTSGYSHVLAEEGRHGFELIKKPYAAEELSRVLRRVTRASPSRA
jgi:GAF domain-containing protein